MPKMRTINEAVKTRIQAQRPYIIKNISEDETEITMYGEVVENRPVDFWTGETIDGLYIVLGDFLNDLEELKNKGSITVHINSPGGDADAGRAIYNRLSELGNVTTVCDSMAASAASIIFMAGENRKMYAGSQLMIHNASTFLFGGYQSRDLAELQGMLDSYDAALAEIYAGKCSKTKVEISHMMDKTTWLSAKDAVEYGFATEVIGESKAVMNSIGGGRYVVCNGVPMRAPFELPEGIEEITDMADAMKVINVTNVPGTPGQKTQSEEGGNAMTLDEFKKEHPELVEQIHNEIRDEITATDAAKNEQAVKDAVLAERKRIADIESIEATIADKDLIEKAKYGDEPMDAKDLALAALQAQAKIGNTILQSMKEDIDASGANDVGAAPAPADPVEEGTPVSDADLDTQVANALKKGGVQ